MVKNPPSNAGNTSSITDQGAEIPRATTQLSLHATTREKPSCHNWRSLSTAAKIWHAATKTEQSQIHFKKISRGSVGREEVEEGGTGQVWSLRVPWVLESGTLCSFAKDARTVVHRLAGNTHSFSQFGRLEGHVGRAGFLWGLSLGLQVTLPFAYPQGYVYLFFS